jgi:hypothetical protein
MSEWLKEHAWKAILASVTKRYRNTSLRIGSTGYATKMLLDVNP